MLSRLARNVPADNGPHGDGLEHRLAILAMASYTYCGSTYYGYTYYGYSYTYYGYSLILWPRAQAGYTHYG